MNSRTRIIASFARGFFTFLEERGIPAVVLHGAADGFERTLSDIDFAVGHIEFDHLPKLIRTYCESQEWLLCQVLRHETTAAYHVCCKADDPTLVVALDACSDYQRNGTRFLAAEELLHSREKLEWGGFKLSTGTELAYRFAKAAAKGKDHGSSHEEFLRYDEPAKSACADWLSKSFGIQIEGWTCEEVANALNALRARSRTRPSLAKPSSLKRMILRALHPSGMVVVTGSEAFGSLAIELRPNFGDLFFRRYQAVPEWRPSLMKDLIMSTLIVVPSLSRRWMRLIPGDCQFHAGGMVPETSISSSLANRLAERCAQWNP